MMGDLYSLALTLPWQITAEAMEAMLSIAARDPLPEDEIARRMHGPKSLSLRSGKRREDSGRMTMREGVAIIPIDGPIYRYADFFTMASGGVTTEALARDLQSALDDSAVSSILFVLDSPGGEVTGAGELTDAIYAARGRKPIVAYIEGYGASVAYRIGSAAERIIADADALVGSIGTIMGVPDPTKRPSYRIDFVSRQSPKKRPDVTTDAGRQVIQELVDELTDVFITQVARNRGIGAEQILALEGALLVGEKAVAAGLADELGSEEGAIRMLAAGALPTRAPLFSVPSFPRIGGERAAQEVSPMADSKGFWAGFWGGAKEAGIVPEAAAEQPAPNTRLVTVTAEQLATIEGATATLQPVQQKGEQDAEIAELRKQLAQARAQQIQTEAQAFVKEQLGQGRAFPAEQAAIVALYIRAAETDATAPRDDGQPSCVALVKAAYTDRPSSPMARHVLAPEIAGTVLANNAGQADAEIAQADASAREYAAKANGKRPT